MKKSITYLLLGFVFLVRCKQEENTVSFPTNIFVSVLNEKKDLLDSATICLFSDFNAYKNAVAAYDVSKAYKVAISKAGKADFTDIEAGKQYWIFSFKKVEKTDFKNAGKIADNFAISDIFTITPKPSSDSKIEITLIQNSGVVVFSFLGQNFGVGLDSAYQIKINDRTMPPYVSNSQGFTDFYPVTVRKNIAFSYLIESNNGKCAWTERDITISNDVTSIILQPCNLVRVGFVHPYRILQNFNDVPIFSALTISGIDKGNIIQADNSYSTCSQKITNTILLSPGNYTYLANFTYAGVSGTFLNQFTVSGLQSCINSTTGVRFEEVIIK